MLFGFFTMRKLLIFLLISFAANLHGQVQRQIDSLKSAISLIQLESPEQQKERAAELILSLNTLGDLYITQGAYDSAIVYALISEKIALSANHPRGLGSAYQTIATAYEEQGEFESSITYYEKALNTFQQAQMRRDEAGVYVGLGNTFLAQGNFEKARTYYLSAMRISQELNDDRGLFSIYGNLANIDFRQKKYDDALLSFLKVEELALKFDNKLALAIAYGNMGAIYTMKKDYSSGINYFEKALEIKLQLGDVKSAALTRYNIGELYYMKDSYDSALTYYVSAYETFRAINAVKWIKTSRMGLFKCHLVLNNLEQAQSFAFEIFAGNRAAIELNFPILTEKEKELYLQLFEEDYNILYRDAFILEEFNPAFTGHVYDNVLYTKGILLKSSTAMRNAIQLSNDAEVINSYDRWITLKNEISQGLAGGKPVQSLEHQADSLEKLLIRTSEVMADFKRMQSIGWKDIQLALKKDEAAIEFVHFSDNVDSTNTRVYAALVVTKNCEQPYLINLTEDTALKKILGAFQGNDLNYIDRVYGYEEDGEQALYKLIWRPLEPVLTDVKRLFVSPSGLLHKIAFSCLSPRKGVLLCDKFVIEMVSSTAVIAAPSVARLNNDAACLLYGGVQYNVTEADRKVWTYLEGSYTETFAIDSLLQKYHFKTLFYKGLEASEASFKKEASSAEVIHVATHGFFYPNPKELELELETAESGDIRFRGNGIGYAQFVQNENPLMRSGLVFAGANGVWSDSPMEEEDGLLTAQEVAHIDMRETQLVVLSACETGLGDIRGSEGVYGLQRAFKMAGVKFIIMSLWQVPDKETAEFMTCFYERLIKKGVIRQAFHETQQIMRKKYEPYYWAAFVLLE